MVQIGTAEFDAEKWCQPTTMNLMGGAAPKDMAKYTDGYKAQMEMTWGATIAAGEGASMCVMGSKAGNGVCAMAMAGDDDGAFGSAMVHAMPREKLTTPQVMPSEEDKAAMMKKMADDGWVAKGVAMVPNAEAGAPDILMEGKTCSVTWYQPKMAKTYATVPRFNAGDSVDSLAGSPVEAEEGEEMSGKPCMAGVKLTGAATLAASVAAIAIALY